MTGLVFHTNPMSRGRMARWMLEETGADYETRIVTYGEVVKGKDYLAINPMGKVPAISHHGKVVTETAAICAYLAEAFPEADLAPKPDERADYSRWLFFTAGPMEAAITNAAMQVVVPADKAGMAGYGNFDLMLSVITAKLEASKYICGDRFTAADVYLGGQVGFGLQFKSLPDHPALIAYRDRVQARPAFRRASELDDAALAEMG